MEHSSSLLGKIKDLSNKVDEVTSSSKRKYNTSFRKKLVTKIEKLIGSKNKEEMSELYNIINKDIGNNFSSNRNGIFINMNILSDDCIKLLQDFIDERSQTTMTQSDIEHGEAANYTKYFTTSNSFKLDEVELISDIGAKLSNQEKHIIKRIRNKDLVK